MQHVKKSIALFSLLISLTIVSKGQTLLSGGDISGTITKAQSPYRVTGDIRIPKDSTLTIEAGVYLDFDSAKLVKVDGALQVMGTEQNPVTFTCSDSLLGWLGVFFIDTKGQDTSFINYTKIEYIGIPRSILQSPYFPDAKHSNGNRYRPTAILAYSAAPLRFSNCIFRRNWQCTEADDADMEFVQSIYSENVQNFGIYTNGLQGDIVNCHFSMYQCRFSNNDVGGWFVGENLKHSNPGEMVGCVFENGWYPLAIGNTKMSIRDCEWKNSKCPNLGFYGGTENTVENCLFDGTYGDCNAGGDLRIYNSAEKTIIKNCTFRNSKIFTGSVQIEQTPPIFFNCMFENNFKAIQHDQANSDLNLINNVFSHNTISILALRPVTAVNTIFANNHHDTLANKSALKDTGFVNSTGAIHALGSTLKLYNCIFWDNRNYFGDLTNVSFKNNLNSIYLYNSIVQGGISSITSPYSNQNFTGTFQNCDTIFPSFIDTANGNFRMAVTCKDFPSGFNKGYAGPISMYYQGKTVNDILSVLNTDMEGNPRIYDDTTDIGPYEIQALANRIDITDSLRDQTICEGKDGAFWAEANSIGLFYEWERKLPNEDWKFHNISPKPITISSAQKQDNGTQYRIKWSNACGVSKTSSEALLNVVTPPVLVLTSSADTINNSQTVDISANNGFVSYIWSNGISGSSQTLKGSDLGIGIHTFVLTAQDSNGCESKDSIKITVLDKSDITDISKNAVAVYPNPTSDRISVNVIGEYKYQVLSLDGQIVLRGKVNGNESIRIDTLVGHSIYIIKIEQQNQSRTGRFIKL